MSDINDFEIKDGTLIKYIGSEAHVKIPNSVTSIDYGAFFSCDSLKSIIIPDSVTSIEKHAFGDCDNLENIVVEENNPKYHSENNCVIETERKVLVLGCKNSIIPCDGSVASIGDGAFLGCSGLKNIVIPNSVTSIESFAFSGCSSLESIIIPNSVTSIGDYVISHCFNLKKLEVDENNPKYFSKGNCVIDKTANSLVLGFHRSLIPDDGSVTSIAPFAFAGCELLEIIIIPGTVKQIRAYAFDGCYNLERAALPDSLEYIGEHAFEGCEGLESIEIPESVTCIADKVFFECSNLKRVTATDSLCFIGFDVFSGCSEDLVITAPKDSYIEEYATKNGIEVNLI